MTALEALESRCGGHDVEELTDLVRKLGKEIHEDRGEVRGKLDAILGEQRAQGERLTRLEERQAAHQSRNEAEHRGLHHRIREVDEAAKAGIREAKDAAGENRKNAWGILAAIAVAIASAVLSIIRR